MKSARKNKRLLDTIRRIHRAGLSAAEWPHVLAGIADCVDAPSVLMFNTDFAAGTTGEFHLHNIDMAYQDAYVEYYHNCDPWLPLARVVETETPHRGTELVADKALLQTEHYNDFLKPQDLRFLLAGVLNRTVRSADIVSAFHGTRQEDFDEESLQTYAILLDHVGQALQVQRALGRLRGLAKGLATAVEHARQAVVLLGVDGRLVHANSAATTMLHLSDGLEVRQGWITTSIPEARPALDSMLSEAFRGLRERVTLERRVASVPRPSGRRAFLVRVFPIDQALEYVDLSEMDDDPHLLMMITDPEEAGHGLVPEELSAVYGLTPAEAALAAALVRGETLAMIATRKGITVDTARKQLQSIFEKTETHRQPELIQRLLLELGPG